MQLLWKLVNRTCIIEIIYLKINTIMFIAFKFTNNTLIRIILILILF
jgi:hypothetical protein